MTVNSMARITIRQWLFSYKNVDQFIAKSSCSAINNGKFQPLSHVIRRHHE